jgi:glucokinase
MTDHNASGEPSVIAIDIGGGSTKLAMVDRRGAIRGWRSFPTTANGGSEFIGKVAAAARQLQNEAEIPVAGISVAVAGFVTTDGAIEFNANLPWLERVPIAAPLAAQLGLKVYIDADSNAACVAEYMFGAGRGSSRFLCLTGGTGLGVGMIVDGKLLRIAHGCMGDAGHVIVSPEGPLCSCGGKGCAEALLSTASLARRYAEIGGREKPSFRALVEDARLGRPAALKIIEEAGYWLGIAAASLASIFLPDRIAIAGGLSQAGDALLASALASFRGHGGSFPLARASMVLASKGEHATLLGAAACFFNTALI